MSPTTKNLTSLNISSGTFSSSSSSANMVPAGSSGRSPPARYSPALTVEKPPGPGSLPSPSPRRAAEPREQGARCGTHHPPPGRRGGGRGRGEPPPQSGSPRPISHHRCCRAAPASNAQALSLVLPLSPNRTGRQHPGPELPPRGMQWTRPERQRRAAGIPSPAHWRGGGKATASGHAPGAPKPRPCSGPAPAQAPPLDPAVGDAAMAAGPVSRHRQPIVLVCIPTFSSSVNVLTTPEISAYNL